MQLIVIIYYLEFFYGPTSSGKTYTMQENIQQQTSTVNRNVQPNDLAGGIDLTAMASVPQGFNAYSFMMKDAAFYEPKEVYKNQKTVDNERVLRGLTRGSDRLHQEMIDQQYK